VSIILLRHGATTLNENGQSADRIRGWLDVPLAPAGVKQAKLAAASLAETHTVSHIYASDLKRAAATARFWSDASKTPMTTTPSLRPWNLGNLAGQPTKAVMPIIKALVAHPEEKPPGGGETFHQFLSRYLTYVLPLVNSQDHYGVVAHLRNVKALEAAMASRAQHAKAGTAWKLTDIHLPTWNAAPKVQPGQAISVAGPRTLAGSTRIAKEISFA
jgi:broad specificity phosphatase PhoE